MSLATRIPCCTPTPPSGTHPRTPTVLAWRVRPATRSYLPDAQMSQINPIDNSPLSRKHPTETRYLSYFLILPIISRLPCLCAISRTASPFPPSLAPPCPSRRLCRMCPPLSPPPASHPQMHRRAASSAPAPRTAYSPPISPSLLPHSLSLRPPPLVSSCPFPCPPAPHSSPLLSRPPTPSLSQPSLLSTLLLHCVFASPVCPLPHPPPLPLFLLLFSIPLLLPSPPPYSPSQLPLSVPPLPSSTPSSPSLLSPPPTSPRLGALLLPSGLQGAFLRTNVSRETMGIGFQKAY